jgi:hypothetical protein
MKSKQIYSMALVGIRIFFLYIVGNTIFDYVKGEPITLSDLIALPLLIMSFMQLKTWGFDQKAQKDEMRKLITSTSAKISYFILTPKY